MKTKLICARLVVTSLMTLANPVVANSSERTESKNLPSNPSERKPAEVSEEAQSNASASAVPDRNALASQGFVEIKDLGIAIIPPKEWKTKTDSASLSMVIEEEKPFEIKEKDGTIIRFTRNITVAAIHEPSPIDETRSEQLKEELVKNFSKTSANYQVLETKLVDYKGSKDAILAYTSMQIGGHLMMQMHLLVSGQERQFLLSYTDMADRFMAQDEAFQMAWQAMSTVEILGKPPGRYDHLIPYGIGALSLMLLFAALVLFRRKSQSGMFDGIDPYESDIPEAAESDSARRTRRSEDHQGSMVSGLSGLDFADVDGTYGEDQNSEFRF